MNITLNIDKVKLLRNSVAMLTEKIARLKEQLENNKGMIVQEKKVYVWWPSLIIIVLCVAGFCFYKIKKRKK